MAAPRQNPRQNPRPARGQSARSRKKSGRQVLRGQVHIRASFNNTIIAISDEQGRVLAISSAGSCGFAGTKKGTAYAASVAVDRVVNLARNNHGLKIVNIFVRGIGQGRDAALRGLLNSGLTVESLADRTPIAHGGVRARGVRHV